MKRILLAIASVFTLFISHAQITTDKVINTLKERITLSGYAQAGYTYDDLKESTNTFDVKRIIFMAHGQITKEWSCYFMYNFNSPCALNTSPSLGENSPSEIFFMFSPV